MQIAFSKLNNKELYTLGLRTKEIISGSPIDEIGLRFYYDAFIKEFDKYEKGIQHESISGEKVAVADDGRDDAYYGFEGNLKNYLYYPDKELKSKINELLSKMTKFGPRVPQQKYKEETATILQLKSIVENGYMDLLKQIHGDVWYNLLIEKQENFEKTLREHTKAQSENNIESATLIRPLLVNAMRNLFSFMPLHYKATQNEDLGKIISQLEVELGRF